MRQQVRLSGLIAAPFTPLHEDGRLNVALIDRLAERLVRDQVSGAFVCGTTGEGLSLTVGERMQVAERWKAAAPPGLKIIVHVGHPSLGESQALAAHAASLGANAIATIGPVFFRPTTPRQLVDYCALVAGAAPSTPFYFYHIPSMTSLHLSMPEFVRLAGERISQFAGLKFTDENLFSFSQCLELDEGHFDVLFGRDEMLLAALAMGATGAVGSTYNYLAPLHRRTIKAFERSDLLAARRHQRAANRIIAVMSAFGGLPAGKAIMKMIGLDCGPVRSPLQPLPPEAEADLRRQLQALDFPTPVPDSER